MISLGLHSARYLNFRKAATCSHSQPLEWPQVAASGRSVEWPQVTASGRLRRVAEVFQSHKKQPLAATCSHSSGRKWPLFPSGRKWPQVAALSSGRNWPQVAAFDAWPRCFNLIKSSHLQPLAATRVAASGRFSRVAASGREWPPLPHNVMNSKLRKTPTRSRRQPTYPTWKKTPFQQNIFFQDVRRLSLKSIA